jgi:hypothetical protein
MHFCIAVRAAFVHGTTVAVRKPIGISAFRAEPVTIFID